MVSVRPYCSNIYNYITEFADSQVSYIQWYHTVPHNGSRKLIRTGSSAGLLLQSFSPTSRPPLVIQPFIVNDYHCTQATLTHSQLLKFVLKTAVKHIFLLFAKKCWLSLHFCFNIQFPPPGVYSCVAGNILGETVSKAFLQINLAGLPASPNNIFILLLLAVILILNTAVK